MSKHTPGPWTITEKNANGTRSPWGYVEVADLRFITVEGRTRDEAKANVCLIAAAPDMLAALRKSADGWANALELGLIPSQHRTAAEVMRDEAFAAIAKAEGRS